MKLLEVHRSKAGGRYYIEYRGKVMNSLNLVVLSFRPSTLQQFIREGALTKEKPNNS